MPFASTFEGGTFFEVEAKKCFQTGKLSTRRDGRIEGKEAIAKGVGE